MEIIFGFGIAVMAFIVIIGTIIPKFLKPLYKIVTIIALVGIVLLAMYLGKKGI